MNVDTHTRQVNELREHCRVVHEQNLAQLQKEVRQDAEFAAKLISVRPTDQPNTVDVRV